MTQRTVTLTFLGASGTVTGSKYLLTVGDRRILVDAGMFQGEKSWREKNWEPFPVDPSTITDLLLTHAHTDHIGYLPALVRRGFRGPIWTAEGSIRLGEIVLRDAGKLQEQATEEAKRGGYSKHANPEPLFDMSDVEQTLPLFRAVEFDEDLDLGDGIVARYVRSGHILASASIHVRTPETSVLFSGDVGRHDHPILKPRDTPPGANVVVMESTYGDREHPEPDVPHQDFAEAINRTIKRGGTVVVPAFAIDRTETILQALVAMHREGRIPDVPVVVDGPMALAAMDVYRSMPDELKDGVTVEDFTDLPQLTETRTGPESKALNRRTDPMIIISSSGMAEGGRVLHHLSRTLPNGRNTVVLTGFQAEGTRGRALEEGARDVKINGRYTRVRAEIVRDREFSVHGDASDLMDWVTSLDPKPQTVYVVHGEAQVATHFADRIEDELDIQTVTPRYGEVVSLVPGAEDPEDLDVEQPAPADPGSEPKD
ncbi:MAG: MBL fold metallo-hydrolase [Micrococcales bacterium]|nr:MBL fold metallo-hydrolase [Micrococcales bacterium]